MRILIAKDEPVIGLCLEDILDGSGHQVCGIATTAKDGVTIAGREKPDLVKMDVMQARGSDGVSAACDIRQRYGIGSVLTSALTEIAVRDRAAPARPLAFLHNPDNPDNPDDQSAVLNRLAADAA